MKAKKSERKETIRDRVARLVANDETTLKDIENFKKKWGEEPAPYHYDGNKRGRG
jgi:hypothetical protein